MFQNPISCCPPQNVTAGGFGISKFDPYSTKNWAWPTASPTPTNWTGANFQQPWRTWNNVAPTWNSWNYPNATFPGWENRFSNWPTPFANNRQPWPTSPNPTNYTSELSFFPTRPGNFIECATFQNPICFDNTGNRWFRLCFDLRGFRPDECCVTLDPKNRCLCVEACHDCNENTFSIKRDYRRKYCFPEEFKVDFTKCDFKCWLSNDGVLCVEAPLPGLSVEEARFWSPANSGFQFPGPFPNISNYTPANVYPVCFKTSGGGGGREQEHQQQQRGGQTQQQPQLQHQHQQTATTTAGTGRQPTAPTQEKR